MVKRLKFVHGQIKILKSKTIISIFCIPAIAAGMLFSACENDLAEVKRVTTRDTLPVQTIFNSTTTYTDSGRVTFEISAGRVDRFLGENPYDNFTDGLIVTSYNRDGSVASKITAENAVNYTKKKRMTARDNVVLENDEGKKLNTEELHWDESEHRIFTDKFVKITTPTEILFGDGLEAEEDFSRYEIKNIKGRIKIEEDEEEAEE